MLALYVNLALVKYGGHMGIYLHMYGNYICFFNTVDICVNYSDRAFYVSRLIPHSVKGELE